MCFAFARVVRVASFYFRFCEIVVFVVVIVCLLVMFVLMFGYYVFVFCGLYCDVGDVEDVVYEVLEWCRGFGLNVFCVVFFCECCCVVGVVVFVCGFYDEFGEFFEFECVDVGEECVWRCVYDGCGGV